MKINIRLFYFYMLLLFVQQLPAQERAASTTNIERTTAQLRNSPSEKVWVIAHRGDWRNAPENSVQAIKNCISMGVDMVEIDVQLTKDGKAVLMHDSTIDRTTTGKGRVGDWTLDSLKNLFLKDGLGIATSHRIPTLEEALLTCKGHILVNIDKGFELFPICYAIAKSTGTLDQIVLKANKSYEEIKEKLGKGFEEVSFMPIINMNSSNAKVLLDNHLRNYKPIAVEFTINKGQEDILKRFQELRQQGINIWVNSLWPKQNAGHDDERAVTDPSIYDWFLENHVNMIQTDRPALLIKYLKSKKQNP
ncbi:MAG: Glycerophosphodiester phosphodiesterase protein family [Sphingobacterium sp.]|jgi:glycerophosphoryl diester phosphodiesterase|nr:Glycerophosphodiester phosphodiesterase protein family [Sphingobacterium sp.]